MLAEYATKPVIIGQYFWIGNNVDRLKGMIIGKNRVIAIGAVVASTVPEYLVPGSVPSRVIKYLNG